MKKKNKVLIATSALSILAVGGITVGVTTALFTAETTSKVHIVAGTLDVGFYATKVTYDAFDDQGLPYTVTIEGDDLKEKYGEEYYDETLQAIDLSKYLDDFEFENIYPTFGGSVSFMVINNSNIAINIYMTGDLSGKFIDEEGTETPMQPEDLEVLNVTIPWLQATPTQVLKGASVEGDVTFELDEEADNDYQGCEFTIDTVIHATQITKTA